MIVAPFIGSSSCVGVPDDAWKDEDAASWVRHLDSETRQPWLDRMGLIRIIDRLAERALLGRGRAFEALLDYVHAEWDYSQPDLAIHTMADHDTMLLRLSGSAFRLLPYAKPHWETIAHFGALDQYWNNVRDLGEDSRRGLCYFPEEVLARLDLVREQVLSGACLGTHRYAELMRFWLDEYQPQVRARAAQFIEATGLHPSLRTMREWCLRRYERVERVFRAVEYDYRRFDAIYWGEIRRDFAGD